MMRPEPWSPNEMTSAPIQDDRHDQRRAPAREGGLGVGFAELELHRAIERGIVAAGWAEPRPIQRQAIPQALDGIDILGLAQTGTGKTGAFALPLLDILLDANEPGPRALILAPTRELATQIQAEIDLLARFTKLKTVSVFGGVSARSQISALRRRPEIVVGCPGRVLDLLGQGVLKLDAVERLGLVEADHMFDMGFLPDIRRILAALPADRQNLFFSATMPKPIRKLADEILDDPHVVELAASAPARTIEHVLYPVSEHRKRDLLDRVLSEDGFGSAIVFTRTKHRARRLAQQLSKEGRRAVGLQGNMSQGQRDRAMKGFRSGQFEIMVATDIAARGIDVSGVSHVINYDVPNTPEAYTHRIGRTGRSEREGKAFTFVTGDDAAWVRATERMIGSRIPRSRVEGFDADDGASRRSAPRGQKAQRGESGRDARPARRGSARKSAPRRSGGSRRRGARRETPAAR